MSDDKAQPEPSMEEILSSIRRIIADEEGEPRERADDPGGGDDVLELTEVMREPPTERPTPPAAAKEPARPEPEENPTMPAQAAEQLVSPVAATATTSALARLTKALEPGDRGQSAVGGLTVEQLMVQLMTPMLKEWLDQNLPPIVERVVEQEVKKLARRAELM